MQKHNCLWGGHTWFNKPFFGGKYYGLSIHPVISVFSPCCWRTLSCKDSCSVWLFTRAIINVICTLFTLQRLALNLYSMFRGAFKGSKCVKVLFVFLFFVFFLHALMMRKRRIMTWGFAVVYITFSHKDIVVIIRMQIILITNSIKHCSSIDVDTIVQQPKDLKILQFGQIPEDTKNWMSNSATRQWCFTITEHCLFYF